MNPFGMSAGEIPDDLADRNYDAATVFKNFASDTRPHFQPRRETAGRSGREFVVEVRKSRKPVAAR
mgnify:CR=1 FL=1